MRAFLARPGGGREPRWPGVLIIHEVFGLNDNMREIARRFAAGGYVGLAIDLFSGANTALCLARALAGIMLRPLDNGTLSALQMALKFLANRSEVDNERIGVIGFCMGGSYALQLACVDGSIRASATFYGQNPRPLEAVARACPIVASYPQYDYTARGGRKLAEALQRFGVPHDVKIYPGTQHAFFNDRGPVHNAAAAEDSWTRTLAFFEQHLGAGASSAAVPDN
ncbi:MAG TPA: dienelactone hydrolase family protein [Chloroflexota bacterium]